MHVESLYVIQVKFSFQGRDMAQVICRRFPTAEAGLDPKTVCVRFEVNSVTLRVVFPCLYNFTDAPFSSFFTSCRYQKDKERSLRNFQKAMLFRILESIRQKSTSSFLIFKQLRSKMLTCGSYSMYSPVRNFAPLFSFLPRVITVFASYHRNLRAYNCNFLHPSLTWYSLGLNIFLKTSFSSITNLRSVQKKERKSMKGRRTFTVT